MRDWVDQNRERINAERRARHAADPGQKRIWDQKYLAANKDRINAAKRGEVNRRINAEAAARKKAWYLANRERIALETKARIEAKRAADPEAFKAAVAARARRRRAADPKRQLHEKMSRLVGKTLKRRRTSKQGKSWPHLVGYTIEALEARLLSTMPAGWTWGDYLAGRLELDHIVPVAAHNFRSARDIDFKRCWALTNLRLLPKPENYEKRAKLLAPFQPALLLADPRGE